MISDQLEPQAHLLAIDLGLRFAWSLYTMDGTLLGYSSHHSPNYSSLKRFAYLMLQRLPSHSEVYIEGGGNLLKAWSKPCEKFNHTLTQVHAYHWRNDILQKVTDHGKYGKNAKKKAIDLASILIKNASGKGHHPLRHDSAEAILLGWWGLWKNESISFHHFKQGFDMRSRN